MLFILQLGANNNLFQKQAIAQHAASADRIFLKRSKLSQLLRDLK